METNLINSLWNHLADRFGATGDLPIHQEAEKDGSSADPWHPSLLIGWLLAYELRQHDVTQLMADEPVFHIINIQLSAISCDELLGQNSRILGIGFFSGFLESVSFHDSWNRFLFRIFLRDLFFWNIHKLLFKILFRIPGTGFTFQDLFQEYSRGFFSRSFWGFFESVSFQHPFEDSFQDFSQDSLEIFWIRFLSRWIIDDLQGSKHLGDHWKFLWGLADSCGFLRILVDSCGFLWILVDSCGFLRILADSCGLLWIC